MSGKMSMPGLHPHYQREEDISVLWELGSGRMTEMNIKPQIFLSLLTQPYKKGGGRPGFAAAEKNQLFWKMKQMLI